MKALLVDDRWIGPHGIGRFAMEVLARLPEGSPIGMRDRLFGPLEPMRLGWKLNAVRPHLFFSPGFNAPVGTRVPIALTVHDLNYVQCAENTDLIRRAYFALIVRPACRRAVRVLTVSEFSRQQIIEWAHLRSDRVVNVGNGVSTIFQSEGVKFEPGYDYVLFVGNPRPHKNLVRLVEAFAAARFDRQIRLVVVGNPEPLALSRATELGIRDRIVLLGYVDDDRLARVYRGALCLAMPSLYEGFGLPIVEAMRSGTPVLTSSVTAMPEIVGDAGVTVDPLRVDEITTALVALCTQEELRVRLICRGIQRGSEFSWDATADRVRQALGLPAPYQK